MSFLGLEYGRAMALFEKLARNDPWKPDGVAFEVQGVETFDTDRAENLYSKLHDLRQTFPIDALPRNRAKDFEAGACGIVHRELRLTPAVAGCAEFWSWLNFCAVGGAFVNLVKWRFGNETSDEPRNFGVTNSASIFEGLLARLWLRGEVGYDPTASDPYELSKRGDIDIWRSHVIRQEYGRCPIVRRALIRFQYPDAAGRKTLSNNQLRELVKLIRIGEASTAYELLDETEVAEIIKELAKQVEAYSSRGHAEDDE